MTVTSPIPSSLTHAAQIHPARSTGSAGFRMSMCHQMAQHPSQCPCTVFVPAAPSGALARHLSIQQLENNLILTQNILQTNDVPEESALHSIATNKRIHILNKSCLMKHHRFLSRQLTLVCTHFHTHIRRDS